MYNAPSGLVWYSRWSGDSDGLSRTNACPRSVTRVWRDRQHVLELPRIPGRGQHRERHRLWRQYSAFRYKYGHPTARVTACCLLLAVESWCTYFSLFFQVRRVKPLLTVTFLSGDISLMNNYDDLSPAVIRSGLKGIEIHVSLWHLQMGSWTLSIIWAITYKAFVLLHSTDVEAQWCSQGDLLAVAGMERHGLTAESACASIMRNALVKFYNVQGEHIYTLETPAQVSPA